MFDISCVLSSSFHLLIRYIDIVFKILRNDSAINGFYQIIALFNGIVGEFLAHSGMEGAIAIVTVC